MCRDVALLDVVVCSGSSQACVQVGMGRKNLEDMCDDIECSSQLPEAFRTLLPCVAWESSICDISPEALREHQVDVVLWTCLKRCIIALARGASNLNYHDMKHSADFIAAKQEWCRRASITSAAERMQSALAEGQIQAVAVQKQQSKAKVRTVLCCTVLYCTVGLCLVHPAYQGLYCNWKGKETTSNPRNDTKLKA